MHDACMHTPYTPQEFLAATMERSVYVREENIRRAFAYFDQDKDGCITMQNLVEIMGRRVDVASGVCPCGVEGRIGMWCGVVRCGVCVAGQSPPTLDAQRSARST